MSVNESVPFYKFMAASRANKSPTTAYWYEGGKIPSTTGLADTNRADSPLYWSTKGEVERPRISPLSPEQARAHLEQIIRADAATIDQPTRWCLRRLLSVCGPLLALKTLRGLFGVLRRLGISRQRARAYIHSPDPQYAQKVAHIQSIITQADNNQRVVVFADQLTYYNQPSVATDYALQKQQPNARWATGGSRTYRITACLNPFDGRVTALQRSKISVPALIEFYRQLQQAYPQAQTIYVVLDNWPVHYHPDVLAALEPQQTPFALPTPVSWHQIKPKLKYRSLNLPIQLLPLPTYASWLNPIERLWKYLKKEIIHNHRLSACPDLLKARLGSLLTDFERGSSALLSYCGLLNPKGIYAHALKRVSAVN